MEYYSAIKNKDPAPIPATTQVNLESMMLSERNQK